MPRFVPVIVRREIINLFGSEKPIPILPHRLVDKAEVWLIERVSLVSPRSPAAHRCSTPHRCSTSHACSWVAPDVAFLHPLSLYLVILSVSVQLGDSLVIHFFQFSLVFLVKFPLHAFPLQVIVQRYKIRSLYWSSSFTLWCLPKRVHWLIWINTWSIWSF